MTKFRKLMSVHWKALSLIAVAVLALASGVYAYWINSVPSAPSPATSTATSYPLELRIELNKTEFQLEEMVTISASLRNISNKTIILHYPSWLPYTNDFTFNITDESGREIYTWTKNFAHLYVTREYTLEPGAEKRGTLQWPQINDVIVEKANNVFENEKVSKGMYKVIVGSGKLRSITFGDSGQMITLGKVDALYASPIAITIN